MFDFVGVLVLVVLVALFGFLAFRSWGSKRAWLKWLGVVLSGLLTLLLTIVLVFVLIGFSKLNAPQSNPVSNLKAATTPEQTAKVSRWIILCSGCHSTAGKPPLDGGKDNFGADPSGPPMGTIYPPNLTPAGPLKDWSDGEVVRAIREGVHKNGRPLIIMPSPAFHNMSDADVQAIVAYLRAQPPVQHDLPDNNVSVFAAFFVGALGAPIQTNQPPITQPIVAPPAGVNAQYGKYMVSIMGCTDCHGADLAGGEAGFGPPPGPNLTAILPKWTEADFLKLMNTGVDQSGKTVTDDMPWKEYKTALTEDEFKAMFMHLKSLQLIDKSKK